MERLTRRDLADVNGKQIVLCDSKEEDCNDSCLYRRCKWNEKALRKLKEYEDAEEQGLLLRLPCKVGDTVWEISRYLTFGECGDKADVWHRIDQQNFTLSMLGYYGKTVFLTKEEAEQALARMENG